MPNNFHLLLKTKNRPLSSSMRKILTGYIVNFNRRHKRYSHLFQNRYKSIVCQEDAYLMELVRYIHLNLLRGGEVKDLSGLDSSLWSGHSAILGKNKRRIISWLAVHELGYSSAEVARHLGVTNSCVTRFLASEKKPDIEEIM